jgi:ribosomal protein S18 acetylase RimI-like enzyme
VTGSQAIKLTYHVPMNVQAASTTSHSPAATTTDWAIRSASWRDMRAVATIQRLSFRPGLAYGMAALIALWLAPGVTFQVASAPNGTITGVVIGDVNRGNARIMNIAVHPDWRRKGIATSLLAALEQAIPTGNVVLMAESWNSGAQALYEREGFVRDGVARDYYGRGKHGVWMCKIRTALPDSTLRV